jgi:hypothetical protein
MGARFTDDINSTKGFMGFMTIDGRRNSNQIIGSPKGLIYNSEKRLTSMLMASNPQSL